MSVEDFLARRTRLAFLDAKAAAAAVPRVSQLACMCLQRICSLPFKLYYISAAAVPWFPNLQLIRMVYISPGVPGL
jgi:hypothetical protein